MKSLWVTRYFPYTHPGRPGAPEMKVVIEEGFNVVFLANNDRIQQASWSSILYWIPMCPLIAFNLVLKSRVNQRPTKSPSDSVLRKWYFSDSQALDWSLQCWDHNSIIAGKFHHNLGNRDLCVDTKIVSISFRVHLLEKQISTRLWVSL